MRIAVVNIPLPVPDDPTKWITVPPQGYGGIQWVVAHLVDGLAQLGHEVFLLGAPGSEPSDTNVTVVDAAEDADMARWLRSARLDVVHDHSNGHVGRGDLPGGAVFVSTHHLTGRPADPGTSVYLSCAQRAAAGGDGAPVIRIPVDARRYRFTAVKDDFALFLGRVSEHKGALEAAAFAEAAGIKLLIAGPTWEPEYVERIERRYGAAVEFVGEVGGEERRRLLARARVVLVMSQLTMGPWGDRWCEPGATVVSEAAASGTPVISTPNGCLSEIVPEVGTVVGYGPSFDPAEAAATLAALPAPHEVRAAAVRLWDHITIARQYETVFRSVLDGRRWG